MPYLKDRSEFDSEAEANNYLRAVMLFPDPEGAEMRKAYCAKFIKEFLVKTQTEMDEIEERYHNQEIPYEVAERYSKLNFAYLNLLIPKFQLLGGFSLPQVESDVSRLNWDGILASAVLRLMLRCHEHHKDLCTLNKVQEAIKEQLLVTKHEVKGLTNINRAWKIYKSVSHLWLADLLLCSGKVSRYPTYDQVLALSEAFRIPATEILIAPRGKKEKPLLDEDFVWRPKTERNFDNLRLPPLTNIIGPLSDNELGFFPAPKRPNKES